MLFIYPMWDSENERLGKKQCTSLGYTLHVVADLIGFAGLLSLTGLLVCYALSFLITAIPRPSGWLFLIPFGVGILGEFLFSYSWRLARKKGFHYDGATRTATWIDNGVTRSYKSTSESKS